MKRTIFTVITLLLSYCFMYAQISTNEEPISFRTNIPTLRGNNNTLKTMPLLDMEKIQQEDKEDEAKRVPPRFGYKHAVNYNLENSGEWINLPSGDRIWRLAITCSDALSINLLYDKFWLPDGAKFFIYSSDRAHRIGAFTSANNKGDRNNVRGFATGLVRSDQITLEYYEPNDVEHSGIISIAYVVHGYRNILLSNNEQSGRGYGDAGSCSININCPEGNDWQKEKNAVAMIVVDGCRWGAGALINTTANDYRPLFLTAEFCVAVSGYTVTFHPNLDDYLFYWHYESPDCISTSEPSFISTSGAMIVAMSNIRAGDFALLQLTEDPKNISGITPYYLGWDRSGNAGMGGVGIHHAIGDIKKISLYTTTPLSTDSFSNSVDTTADYWRVIWNSGAEFGSAASAGAPLINSNRKVIGLLQWGFAGCDAPTYPYWCSKLSKAWTGHGTNQTRLSSWLDPNNTNVMVLDGRCLPENFNEDVYLANRNFENDCGDINAQGAKVRNGKRLTLKAAGSVKIPSNFRVELGSSLRIQ